VRRERIEKWNQFELSRSALKRFLWPRGVEPASILAIWYWAYHDWKHFSESESERQVAAPLVLVLFGRPGLLRKKKKKLRIRFVSAKIWTRLSIPSGHRNGTKNSPFGSLGFSDFKEQRNRYCRIMLALINCLFVLRLPPIFVMQVGCL